MTKDLEKKILFLTPTFGTRWLFYQQYLLNQFFPLSGKIIIDGNLRWDFTLGLECVWYDFIKKAIAHKNTYTYFVHMDEDCFITDPQGIIEAIESLERNEFDLIGPPDNIRNIRGENPKALNSFLMIGKIRSLEQVMAGYEIDLTFNELNIPIEPPIEAYKIEYEPYYEFFWNYYKKGFKIGFAKADFHDLYQCTTLLTDSGTVYGLHMWFTRSWYSKKKNDYWGISEYERYKRVEKFLQQTFDLSFSDVVKAAPFKHTYIGLLYSRTVLKNVYRLKKRLFK